MLFLLNHAPCTFSFFHFLSSLHIHIHIHIHKREAAKEVTGISRTTAMTAHLLQPASSILILTLLLCATMASSDCTCDHESTSSDHKSSALAYKLGSIAIILVAGGIGVSIPLLGKKMIPTLNPENDIFFMVKAFAAGVILATAFIHILPDAFENLTSSCLGDHPWRSFPFTGFFAMVSAIGTLMIDSLATGYYRRQHLKKPKQVSVADVDEERMNIDEQTGAGHVHGHGHGHHESVSPSQELGLPEVIRRRIVSQVSINFFVF